MNETRINAEFYENITIRTCIPWSSRLAEMIGVSKPIKKMLTYSEYYKIQDHAIIHNMNMRVLQYKVHIH
jgi:hypothetical protein